MPESDEEFWVRTPNHPAERTIWVRVIDRERAEIIGEGDEEPTPVSLYELWMTDRHDGLSQINKNMTPWGDSDVGE